MKLVLLKHVPDAYLSRYIGVATSESLQAVKHHQFLLAQFLGSVVENVTNAESCHKLADNNDVSGFSKFSGHKGF